MKVSAAKIIAYGSALMLPYVILSFYLNQFPRGPLLLFVFPISLMILWMGIRATLASENYLSRLKKAIIISSVATAIFGVIFSIKLLMFDASAIDKSVEFTSSKLVEAKRMSAEEVTSHKLEVRNIVVRNMLLFPFLYLAFQLYLFSFLAAALPLKRGIGSRD